MGKKDDLKLSSKSVYEYLSKNPGSKKELLSLAIFGARISG